MKGEEKMMEEEERRKRKEKKKTRYVIYKKFPLYMCQIEYNK